MSRAHEMSRKVVHYTLPNDHTGTQIRHENVINYEKIKFNFSKICTNN